MSSPRRVEVGDEVCWLELAREGGKAGWQRTGVLKLIAGPGGMVWTGEKNVVIPLSELYPLGKMED